MERLKVKDYIKIINTLLMLIMGTVILYKSFRDTLTFNFYLIGILFVGFGIYRIKLIKDYFKRVKNNENQ
ncbi:MAG: hypothetical protein ABH873_08270 [Candidatus Firestonebacteria bacterium]